MSLLFIVSLILSFFSPVYAAQMPAADHAAPTAVLSSPQRRVNLNQADVAQLSTVKGIGAARAQAIIAYRQGHGPFSSVQDLAKVKGIGAKRLKALMPQLTV